MKKEEQYEIDRLYMREAYKMAMKSPDPSTQNGSIIIRTNEYFSMDAANLISTGFNGFPAGFEVTPERLERPLKYSCIDHAETSAIYEAARIGKPTLGGIMYVPWFACDKCGVGIVQAGINEVIGYAGPERWWKERNEAQGEGKNWYDTIELALTMLHETGVKCRWIDGPIGDVEVLFDGKKRKP